MTLALQWEDFRAHCYSRERLTPDQAREFRMLFYTGFHACLMCMAKLQEADLSEEEQREQIHGYLEEWQAFAREYIEQRQREQ